MNLPRLLRSDWKEILKMLRPFRLEEPESVADVSELLSRFGESAKLYAGGTELLLAMKEGLVHYERLINVKIVKGLNEVRSDDGIIRIGALCTHHELETSPLLQQKLPALVQLEQNVANVRVRQVGTLGGNLCFAEPHADPGILLLALGAMMLAEKSGSKREIPAAKFFVDAYETSLEADEVLTEIRVPMAVVKSGVSYLKFGFLERPSVGVAVALHVNDGGKSVHDIKIAVGCAGPAPKRVPEAEEQIKGTTIDEAKVNILKAGEIAGRASQAISDLHGSQEYKEHIVGVLLKRAFQNALTQC
jgi:aerobic carbon-monoxide dehydrogenase medium subunit